MAKISTNTPDIKLYNTNIKLKQMLIRVANSEGRTLTSWAMIKLKEAALAYPERARNYQKDDDGC